MKFCLGMVGIAVIVLPCLASNKDVGWRTDGSGIYLKAKPPLHWSKEKNVVWKTKLPNWSNAQPVLVGDRIFVNSEPTTLVCLDVNNGNILWQATNRYEDAMSESELAKLQDGVEEKAAPIREQIAEAKKKLADMRKQYEETQDRALRGRMRGVHLKLRSLDKQLNQVDPLNLPSNHRDNGFSSAVPVSDGTHVYAVYGNGVVSCFDLEGKRVWSRFIEKPNHHWGHSASPVLSGDKLMVHILDVVALNKNSGEELWRTQSKESWGTPLLTSLGGEAVLITAAQADVLRVADGKKLLAEAAGLKFASPVMSDEVVYFIEGNARAYARPVMDGDQVVFKQIWESKIKGSRHYASSVIKGNYIYAASREGWLNVLDRATGKVVYEKELGINGDNVNSVYPSVSAAGNHIFIGFQEGVTLVLEEGGSFKEVARNDLESFRGSPIFEGGRIYIRGLEHLYCIGE